MRSIRIAAMAAFVPLVLGAPVAAAQPANGGNPPVVWTIDNGWQHGGLQATDATTIAFDYQVSRSSAQPNGASSANVVNGWLNVAKAGFNGSEQVRAVIIVYGIDNKSLEARYYNGATQDETHQVDLSWDAANQKFTASLPQMPYMYYQGDGDDEFTAHFYDIAVVVNGTWLIDPVSGQHNFRYTPAEFF